MPFTPEYVILDGKSPLEEVDYPISLVPWLPTGDTPSSLTSVVASAGITVAAGPTPPAPTITGNVLTFWLSGGTHGITYTIRAIFVTTGGRTLVADFRVTVTDPRA